MDHIFNEEQLIIDLINENLHALIENKSLNKKTVEILYEQLLKEGILKDMTKSKFFKIVAYGTLAVMASNATINFALSKSGLVHNPDTSTYEQVENAFLGGGSDRTESLEVLNNTDIEKGAIKTSDWTPLESLAKAGDAEEELWNEIKNHPILRALFIGKVFINSGSNFKVSDHAKIKFEDDKDLLKKLKALGEFDAGWESQALILAKQQKTYKKKVIFLSFDNAWCGGYAAFMLRPGHGIPSKAVRKMSSNESYGEYMKKHAPKGMFFHKNKKALDIDNIKYRTKLVPGAVLQIGKSKGRWAGHYITIVGVGLKGDKLVVYTIEGNTLPESITQAVSLGLQELYDNFSGLEESDTTGKIADAFKRVATGNASGSGRAVSGKVRTLESLRGQVFSITLPKYSQKIVGLSMLALKGMDSEAKKLTKKQIAARKSKRKMQKKSRKRNRQHSGLELFGSILNEYIKATINDIKS
mgnify:CR=1 FL=1